VLKPDDKFCSQCALVLDQETALKLEKGKEKLDLSFLEVSSVDPKVLEKIAMEVKKILNQ
jgi:hypothetical protein